jgi:predicted HAD superfamily Cof-like phosphohydrolase
MTADQLSQLMDPQSMVREFHEQFRLGAPDAWTNQPWSIAKLRETLISEELEEFMDGAHQCDPVAVADAIADLLYVVYGTAVQYGIEIAPVLTEVHRSNMTKLWTDEEIQIALPPAVTIDRVSHGPRGWLVKRQDGKVIKSPSYEPADIAGALTQPAPSRRSGPLR